MADGALEAQAGEAAQSRLPRAAGGAERESATCGEPDLRGEGKMSDDRENERRAEAGGVGCSACGMRRGPVSVGIAHIRPPTRGHTPKLSHAGPVGGGGMGQVSGL